MSFDHHSHYSLCLEWAKWMNACPTSPPHSIRSSHPPPSQGISPLFVKPIEWRDGRVATGGDHLSGTDCIQKEAKRGCGPLFSSEGFAHPVPHNTKMVLRCPKDYFGSLLSRYQGHTSQVSWIASLRALRPCRNKPEQTGWHKFFLFPKWRSDTSYVTWWSLEWHRLQRRMACFSNMHQNRVWSHFEAVVWILAKFVMATLGAASDPRQTVSHTGQVERQCSKVISFPLTHRVWSPIRFWRFRTPCATQYWNGLKMS